MIKQNCSNIKNLLGSENILDLNKYFIATSHLITDPSNVKKIPKSYNSTEK